MRKAVSSIRNKGANTEIRRFGLAVLDNKVLVQNEVLT